MRDRTRTRSTTTTTRGQVGGGRGSKGENMAISVTRRVEDGRQREEDIGLHRGQEKQKPTYLEQAEGPGQ